MQFHIENMTCGGCARGVTKAIQSVDPTAEVTADPPRRQVQVKSSAAQEKIEAALREAGFPPSAA
ncbi:MAG: heavy-metal-associated domain-containing protein [Candidatus Competibacteraceae bacterium]|nr:heavy-metal-associated domain-containing protein [Candidatus Competibacteraceae bacterium]